MAQTESRRQDTAARSARRDRMVRRSELRDRLAVHGFDVDLETYRAANLRDWASMLDLGSGRAGFLLKVRERWHHQGLLVALDRSSSLLASARMEAARRSQTLQTIAACAAALPFADECFDGVYHRHPLRSGAGCGGSSELLLREIRRVIRPAGRAVFVVRSQVYDRLTREFLRRLVREVPGLRMRASSEGMTAERATEVLGPIFGPLEVRVRNEALHFREVEQYLDYFDTFHTEFEPTPPEALWRSAMDRVAGWLPSWFETRRALSEPTSFNILVATVL